METKTEIQAKLDKLVAKGAELYAQYLRLHSFSPMHDLRVKMGRIETKIYNLHEKMDSL